MAGILYSSHVCAVSKWACFPTHTSNHAMSHLLCLKNKLLFLNCMLYCFLIMGMSPPTSNYSRLSCFSKINKSFFHSFCCFCIPRKNPRAPNHQGEVPELQALAMLGVLGPTIRAKSDCGCARSLNSFWPKSSDLRGPKKCFSVDAKNSKEGFKWLGLF